MDNELDMGTKPAAKKPAAKRTKKPKADAVFGDPEKPGKDPRSGWPIVVIDDVEGQPNYEVVGVNGKVYQIMRSVEVPVPPEVVSTLKDAVEDKVVQSRNAQGLIETKVYKKSAVPWRIVGYTP